jgi:HEAT repeat protein
MNLFGPPKVENMKRKRDIPGLIKALSYPRDAKIRYTAAAALGIVGGQPAVNPLINALNDNNIAVRHAAARALGEIRDIRAINPLIAALKDNTLIDHPFINELIDTQEAPIWALKKIGEPTIQPLISALKDNDNVYIGAVKVLAEIGDKRAVEPLIAILENDERCFMINRAAAGMGRIKDPRAIEPLIAVACRLEDRHRDSHISYAHDYHNNDLTEQEKTHWAVLESLIKFSSVAVKPLIAMLNREIQDWIWRRQSIEALAKIGDKQAIKPLITILGQDRIHRETAV